MTINYEDITGHTLLFRSLSLFWGFNCSLTWCWSSWALCWTRRKAVDELRVIRRDVCCLAATPRERQRVALIENQLNTCPWRTSSPRVYAAVTCPLDFVLNRYTNKDLFVLWVRKRIPTQKVVPCVTCKTVSRCVVLCSCPSPPPLIKCSAVLVWNVFPVGTCVEELWAVQCLSAPGASSEQSRWQRGALQGHAKWRGVVGFFFPWVFLCCITSCYVVTGLSPCHMRASLKPVSVLKLAAAGILLMSGLLLQLMRWRWTGEAGSA